LGNNINSNNFLEVLIAGVELTPRVKDVGTFEGNRRVKASMLNALVAAASSVGEFHILIN